MCWGVLPWVYPVCDSLGFLDWVAISVPILGKFSAIISSSIFSRPFFFVFFFWDSYDLNVGAFHIVPEVPEVVLISFDSFLFFLLNLFPPFYLLPHLSNLLPTLFYCWFPPECFGFQSLQYSLLIDSFLFPLGPF